VSKLQPEDDIKAAAGCVIIGVWLLSILLSLGFTAVVIWAIIKLVAHWTA
jgi:hypothetical protein